MARRALQNLGFPFNIYTMAEASDFRFGTQLGFAKAHHKNKITPGGKSGRGLGLGKQYEASKCLGIPFNISATAALSS